MSFAELAAYNKPDRQKIRCEGAKKEGVVTWCTSLIGGPNTDMPRVFSVKYPGVSVEVYRGDSDALMSRIMQEAQAKKYIVNTVETTFPVLKVTRKLKLLQSSLSPHLTANPDETKEKAEKGWSFGPPTVSRTLARLRTPIP